MTTSNMKQIQFATYGNADVLKISDTAVPTPQNGQLLVKIRAAGVNYSDILRRRNTYFQPTPLPFVLGAEAVGTVQTLGEGVGNPFSIGTRVLAMLPAGGGYAEYAIAQAAYCIPLPDALTDEAAATLFVQGTTAYLLASTVAGNVAGKTVLVNAAAGGVGSLLVQILKQLGAAKVVAAGSSSEKMQVAEHLGADAAVQYTKDDWVEKAIAANNNQLFDVVYEMAGGQVFNGSLACLADGGTMAIYGVASGVQGQLVPEHLIDHNQTITAFNLAYYIQHKGQLWGQALQAVMGMLMGGQLVVHSPKIFKLEEAALAHTAIEQRETTGKVILKP